MAKKDLNFDALKPIEVNGEYVHSFIMNKKLEDRYRKVLLVSNDTIYMQKANGAGEEITIADFIKYKWQFANIVDNEILNKKFAEIKNTIENVKGLTNSYNGLN